MSRDLISKSKDVLPPEVVSFGKAVLNGFPSLLSGFFRQALRFNASYARDNSSGVQQLEAKLVYFTHQVEKGLSHEHFRYGFGRKVLSNLSKTMSSFKVAYPSYLQTTAYLSALSALKEYWDRHEGDSEVRDYFKGVFGDSLMSEILSGSPCPGGSLSIGKACDHLRSNRNLAELLNDRHSIREYSSAEVNDEDIKSCVELAMRAPSACNRQPSRVRIIKNPDLVKDALSIASGFGGYACPSALLLITVDNRVYFGPQERNEGFVDGGVFSMALLLALEDKGLAACPLNTMLRKGPEKRMRQLLRIEKWEEPIMFIAVGHFPDEPMTCCSARLHAEDVIDVLN